jgi:hypothetical protein
VADNRQVHLFVLPYNFPVLWQLLGELFKNSKVTGSSKWRREFEIYLSKLPPYYYRFLRAALTKWYVRRGVLVCKYVCMRRADERL